MTYVIVRESDGARYCQDGKWRDFAGFGSYRCCVKEWRKHGWASRKAYQLMAFNGASLKILGFNHERYMDAAGQVWRVDPTTGEEHKAMI